MAQQQYWKWTDLHWYGLLMEISLEIKGANPADFFSSSECCSNSLSNGSFPYIVTFLIPATVYRDDAQP